ncbi:TssA family type VI secretion system protein [Halorhodospira halophila]|uniref:ImpA domain protein n=1 Tax=Halorhodospira halophila (strain DSM 244 / SL1) TaxID=349124 RepID=A1WTE4_HALHL|nr:TssA family type VI secretion system protein [Halorhodospira halophila]ABM60956.1 ImpA domain protein [Halorhodospira halophila SL1]
MTEECHPDATDHPLGLPGRVLAALDGDADVGADPRHGERFARLREAVQRLGGADFAQVAEDAAVLLEQEAKDLRVLGYLCLAELQERGLEGFRAALAALHGALAAFGERIHPQRDGGRRAAIEWLSERRMLALLDRAAGRDDPEQLRALEAELDRLGAELERLWSDPPGLRPLRNWVQERQTAVAVATERTAPTQPGAREDDRSPGPPRSGQELGRRLREALDFLRSEGEWLAMTALARAWRWGRLGPLSADDGRLRIEPPRQVALTAIRRHVDEGAWEAAYLAAESAFLEPGGHLQLEIQAVAERSATAMGRDDIAAYIRAAAAELLQRHPALPDLRFSDGSPLVPPGQVAWVADRVGTGDESPWREEGETPVQLGEALALMRSEGLAAALRQIDATPQRSGRERCAQELVRARLCLDAGYPELARARLELLAAEIERRGLDEWDPESTLAVWRELALALQASERDGQLDREQVARRLLALRHRVARADLEAAIAFP